jgi:hypothetical protein
MLAGMGNTHRPAVMNHLPDVLRRRGMSWGELSRRTLIPQRLLARLRGPGGNPRLVIAERIAAALELPVERLWKLPARR